MGGAPLRGLGFDGGCLEKNRWMGGNDSFRTNMRNRVKSNSRNFDESLACMSIFIDTSLIWVKLFRRKKLF